MLSVCCKSPKRSAMSRTILKYKNKVGIYYNVEPLLLKRWYDNAKLRGKSIKSKFGCEFEDLEIKETYHGEFYKPLQYEWEYGRLVDSLPKMNDWCGHINELLIVHLANEGKYTHDKEASQNFQKIVSILEKTEHKIDSIEKWEEFLYENREEISTKKLLLHYCMAFNVNYPYAR